MGAQRVLRVCFVGCMHATMRYVRIVCTGIYLRQDYPMRITQNTRPDCIYTANEKKEEKKWNYFHLTSNINVMQYLINEIQNKREGREIERARKRPHMKWQNGETLNIITMLFMHKHNSSELCAIRALERPFMMRLHTIMCNGFGCIYIPTPTYDRRLRDRENSHY